MSIRRNARRHTSGISQEVDESYWLFKPGQRVMTVDGLPGVVTEVQDGPFAGDEQYLVTLDNGLGGGEYDSSMLTEMPGTTAARAAEVEAAMDLVASIPNEAAPSARTASEDYPELVNILTERPPLAHAEPLVMRASKHEDKEAAKTDWQALYKHFVCDKCGFAGDVDPVTDLATGQKIDVCPSCGDRSEYVEIGADGWPLVPSDDPLYQPTTRAASTDKKMSVEQSADEHVFFATAGLFDKVLQGGANFLDSQMKPEWQYKPGNNYSYDWCFTPDAPVLMADGTEKPISQIEVGDRVITHTGRIQPVTWVGSRPYEGDLVRVSVYGDTTREVVATDNHRFWAANRDFGLVGNTKAAYSRGLQPASISPRSGWDEVGNLQPMDYLSRSVLIGEHPVLVSYSDARTAQVREIKITGDLAWLLGLYMGDGFPQSSRVTSFSIGSGQQEIIDRIRRVAVEYLDGATVAVYPEPGKQAVRVDVRDWGFRRLSEEFVGHGSATKRLDGRLLTLPLADQEMLLEGYLDADGCRSDDGRNCADSISVMPRQVREIATRLGHLVNMRPKDSSQQYANAQPQTRVEWWAGRNRLTKQFERDGEVWQQIKSVRRTRYIGEVWDIEVAEDHSFRAYGFNVHNCRFRKNERCLFPKHLDVEGTKEAGYTVWAPEDRGMCPRNTWDEQKDCPVGEPGPHSGDPHAYSDATVSWADGGQRPPHRHSSLIAEAGFEVTAAWADVRNKAKRIRSEGGVRIISAPREGDDTLTVTAEVKGDQNVYETTLLREPGRHNVASWRCGCAWAAYSWGRRGRYQRFEGRMCSHALALQYEAQSRGMFGKTITEDAKTPPWRVGQDPFQYVKPDRGYARAASKTGARMVCARCGSDDIDYSGPYQDKCFQCGSTEQKPEGLCDLCGKAPAVHFGPQGYTCAECSKGVTIWASKDQPFRPVYDDPLFADAPITVIAADGGLSVTSTAAAEVMDFGGRLNALVHGVVQQIMHITGRDAVTGSGAMVPVNEVLYPTYSPTRGLTLTVNAALHDEPEPALPQTEGEDDALAFEGSKTAMAIAFTPDATAEQAADELLMWAHQHDALVTNAVRDVTDATDGEMDAAFLPNRIKGRQRAIEKIKADVEEKHKTPAEIAMRFADSLRFTILYSTQDYAFQTAEFLRQMATRGFRPDSPDRVKNFWLRDDPYDGINSVLRAPDGFPFEVQFHTSQSMGLKNSIHGLYEEYRGSKGPVSPERRRFLWDEMIARGNTVERATWESDVGEQTRHTFAAAKEGEQNFYYAFLGDIQGEYNGVFRRVESPTDVRFERYSISQGRWIEDNKLIRHLVNGSVDVDPVDELTAQIIVNTLKKSPGRQAALDTEALHDEALVVDALVDPSTAPIMAEAVTESLVAAPPSPGDPRLAWLMGGASGGAETGGSPQTASDGDIAAQAKAFLAKQALKSFTPAEQKEIIEEGLDVLAANLGDLDLEGTHYLGLEAAFRQAEEEDDL